MSKMTGEVTGFTCPRDHTDPRNLSALEFKEHDYCQRYECKNCYAIIKKHLYNDKKFNTEYRKMNRKLVKVTFKYHDDSEQVWSGEDATEWFDKINNALGFYQNHGQSLELPKETYDTFQ